jgi:hypothetical protein
MTEDFDSKRPDHPDFMTHGELKLREFSGIRHNSIDQSVEVWYMGTIAEVIPQQMLMLDANTAIGQALERVFGIRVVFVKGEENAIKLH